MRCVFNLDGPLTPVDVDPTGSAFWWSDRHGLDYRHEAFDRRPLEQGLELYAIHYCPSEHRPSRRNHMTSPFETFVAPEIEDGDTFKPHEHIGAVVIVKARERKNGVVTPNTPDPGGPAVIVDLVDLTDGQKYLNVLWMGGAFVDALTPYVGKGPVVLEIESRTGKSGRAYGAPKAASDAQIQLATQYYTAKGDPFAQTFATVITEDTSKPAWA